jgi:predicted nucleic acid-binding protein
MLVHRAFVDTNIFAYAFDQRDPVKRRVAIALIVDMLRASKGVISYQVIQEFLNVAIRASVPGLTLEEGRRYLHDVVVKFEIVAPTLALFETGLHLQSRYKLPWYDCLVIAAAFEAHCETIYTEDWQHGQVIEGITITNPFV